MSQNPNPRSTRWTTLALFPIVITAIWFLRQVPSEPPRPTASERGDAAVPARGTLKPSSSAAAPDETPAGTPTAAASPSLDSEFDSGENLPADFLDRIVSGRMVRFQLPDGLQASGDVSLMERDPQGVLFVQGRLTAPSPGFYFFQRQTVRGIAGPLVGHVRFDGKDDAWKIEPDATLESARMVARKLDEIICANYEHAPEPAGDDSEEAPQTHPNPVPIPPYQTVIPLQSLPGATAVIYLDFDGEEGPFPGWGDFDAAPANATNNQIFDVWKMVCEDFQGFNINVTTDRKVFDSAPEGRRAHCIISPTTNAAPGAGGVAYVGSFNWSGDRVCWAFYSTGKSACEVISHEIGHTLGLSHDGRISPSEGYYGGHGSGATGWAPIMGVGYYQNLSQWSKGEYLSANQTQDDLSIIVNNNNDVDYRTDDTGDAQAGAKYLEILADNSVSNEGIIETTGDIDSFRFATSGGTATLNINTVALNPNLDILAEIVDAAGSTIVATDNPDTGINATVSANLSAGEYLLRVRGTGRGSALADGYTNYASLGSYLITGSVAGGIKSERFSIAENSPNGTAVGTVVPRNNHAGAALTYAISNGNSGGAFSINPSTGAISVANSAILNFEALSLRWDDPATIELFVSITNPLNSALNENLRTVVTVINANESPTITGGSQTILEHSVIGTKVITVQASDVDHYDFPLYSITAGNTGNVFAIDSGTGRITVAADISVTSNTVFNLVVQAADQGSPALTSSTPVTITVLNIPDGYQPGRIVRTYFENISGETVANLTGNTRFPNTPDSEQFLTSFDGGEHGDNFGSTIRGYLIPPATGTYQFWIASDDASELRLSTNSNPAGASVRATVSGWTDPYVWTANASQQSATVNLVAGTPYYIEARHKEGGGGDHLAVAWSGPGFTRQVISGLYLAPFYQNYAPKVNAATFSVRENAVPGQVFGTATSSDVNAQDGFSGYAILSGNTGGVFGINPSTGQLNVATAGLLNAAATPGYTLTVRSTDNGTPALNGTGTITVNVLSASTLNVTGIVQEIWTGLSGTALSTLTGATTYPFKPNTRRTLGSFDSGADYAENYGSRIRARFIPPTTGNYRFYLAGDDDSRLLFSSDPTGAGASQIASISGWTNRQEWTKYASQTSAVISLTAGQAVYLETLQKEGGGGDHVSVGYTSPDVATTTVIPGSMLQPFDINASPVFSPATYAFNVNATTASAGMSVGSVTATEPNGESLVFAIQSGNTAGAFAIHASTGAITVTNPSLLGNGLTVLQVVVQDGGLGGEYPLKSATATVNITITGNNSAPTFTGSPITRPAATEESLYNQSLAGLASDANPGDTLTFTKTSGPSWMSVAANGDLSGTPLDADVGSNSFVVRVTDQIGAFSEATLNITVTDVWHSPAFSSDPISMDVLKNHPVSGNLTATDTDTRETLSYSKVSGPAWLLVAPDGSLSGTPLAANVGNNSFVVRVTDDKGLSDDASLLVNVINEPRWTNTSGGSWPVAPNWQAGLIASGNASVANFASLDLTSDTMVTLDGARTIGGLAFADITPSHNWTLNSGSGGPLTLIASAGVPSIVVSNQSATLNLVLAGNQGWVKSGAGILTLGAANSITGGLTVDGGTVRFQSGDYTNTLPAGTQVTINSSATVALVNTNVSNSISTWTVNSGGVLNCQGYHAHLSGVTLNGGSITGTGSGKYAGEDFVLDSDLATGGTSASTINIANGIGIGGGNRTFTVPDTTSSGAVDLTISGAGGLKNSGTLVKAGAGTLALNNINLHGATTVNGGTLLLGSGGATGAIRNTLVVNTGARVDYTTDNTFGYNSGSSVNSLQILGGTVGGANFNQHFWNSFQLGMTGGTLHLGGSSNEFHNATVTANASPITSRILPVGGSPQLRLRDGTPITFNVADGTQSVDLSVEVPVTQNGISALTKSGAGTMRMTAASTYTGATSINEGTFVLTGSLANSPVSVGASGRLAGTGSLAGAVTSSGAIAPGSDGTGNLTIQNTLTLMPSSVLEWQVGDWNGAAGSGFDTLTLTGLNVSATSATPIVVRISAPALANFSETNKSFVIASVSGTISGFDPSKFQIDGSAFTQGTGSWTVQQSGGLILLVYTRFNTTPFFPVNPITLGATQGTALTGQLSATDPDLGETLAFSKSSGPAWLDVSPSGVLSGTPANGDVGNASFTVQVTDSFNSTASATLQISVANLNEAPTFVSGTLSGTSATEDSNYAGSVSTEASDPDLIHGDTLVFSKVAGPAWLNVAANGTLSGVPANSDVGANTFTLRVTDAAGLFAETQLGIEVTNTNDAPVFAADPIHLNATEDTAFTGQLAASDVDAGDTLVFAKVSGPAWLAVSTSGELNGIPSNSEVGLNTFTVSVSDGGITTNAVLHITVANTNDAPVFAADPIHLNATEDTAFTGQLAASDVDAGDTLVFAKVSGPAWLAVSTSGELTGTPSNNEVGLNTFTVSVSDGGITTNAVLHITVTNTNDAPVFAASTISGAGATGGEAYSGSLAGTATDVDAGDTLTYSKTSGPAWLTVATDGTLGGTPSNSDAGSNAFTIRATDGGGLHAESTLLIEVVANNPDANTNGMLDTWETAKFGNADPGANPPDGDPDGDGLNNLLEYALDTHPLQANASPLVHDLVADSGERYLRLTVPKNPLATNLAYTVETCGALNDWSSAGTVVESDTAGQLVVRDGSAVSSTTRRFIRLKVATLP